MLIQRQEGQGLVEYALILVLVAIVVIAILAVLGPKSGISLAKSRLAWVVRRSTHNRHNTSPVDFDRAFCFTSPSP